MTALVAAMNKRAIALAGDSVGTLTLQGLDANGQPALLHKHYPANKIFALSKHAPLGIMTAGQSHIFGIPWETLIKRYRQERTLSPGGLPIRLPYLCNWVEDFRSWMGSQASHLPDNAVINELKLLYRQLLRQVIISIPYDGDVEKWRINFENAIVERTEAAKSQPHIGDFYEAEEQDIISKGKETWKLEEQASFESMKRPLLDLSDLRERLLHIAGAHDGPHRDFCRSEFMIAGYGGEQWFPGFHWHPVNGMVGRKIAWGESNADGIGWEKTSLLRPMAQRETMDLYLHGIALPLLQEADRILGTIPEALGQAAAAIAQGSGHAALSETLATSIAQMSQSLLSGVVTHIRKKANQTHTKPLMDSVSLLDKQELATFAESLVMITALKMRMAVNAAETVGGPIEVAVISRDEGFVWIKRKHYFDSALNPSFASAHPRL